MSAAKRWTYVEPWVPQDPAAWERVGVRPFLRAGEVLVDVEADGPVRHCSACGGRVVLIRYTWPVESPTAAEPPCKSTSWRHADGSPSHDAFAADLRPHPYCEGCAADVGAGHCPTCHTDGALATEPTAWHDEPSCSTPGCSAAGNHDRAGELPAAGLDHPTS